ncbi:unnamed protein product [Vitrella brassicaformis CCMP3155]|uniref:Uncharacterized protein n=1 Tax=Vitrella brassicaformis (strain CCMP3155) TaxID=1169540 RepID=A0A0G4EEL0_VITBC|nr:unnamed protein product [Vitrella brassicaformis CCMP3155]|eukprot:CEL94111.1 unnamed protein product [Vitrella brassicaformis CCMP3155]
MVDSIPPWMAEVNSDGSNRCFPSVKYLYADLISTGQNQPGDSQLPAAQAGKLRAFFAGLKAVSKVHLMASCVSTVSQFAACLPLKSDDESDAHLGALTITLGHDAAHLPAASHALVAGLRYPYVPFVEVESLHEVSRACVRSLIDLMLAMRPVNAEIEVNVSKDDLGSEAGDEGEDGPDWEVMQAALNTFSQECQVQASVATVGYRVEVSAGIDNPVWGANEPALDQYQLHLKLELPRQDEAESEEEEEMELEDWWGL